MPTGCSKQPNGTVRFCRLTTPVGRQPLWRHTRDVIVGGGRIGDVQYVIGTLSGGRAMLFRNGTHLIDAICYFADSDPEWVSAELEDGYDDYNEYKGDGGHVPATEPSAHGYIHFANGVRGYYAGGPKTTLSGFRVEIVGTNGYILISDKGATLHQDDAVETIDGTDMGHRRYSCGSPRVGRSYYRGWRACFTGD